MNKITPRLLGLTALLVVASTFAQNTTTPPAPPAKRVNSTGGNSEHETTSTVIGDRRTGNRVTISYGRPHTIKPGTTAVRKIWGGQVKWDVADRLGADEATLLITQQPLVIQEKPTLPGSEKIIPAGAYTLYIIPSENGPSKLAFSSKLGGWGIPVDEKQDVGRFELTKDTLEKAVDQLTIAVVNDKTKPDSGTIMIAWENTQFSLPFTVKKPSS